MTDAPTPAPVLPSDMADLMHRVLYGHRGYDNGKQHRAAPARAVEFVFVGRDLEIAHAIHRLSNAVGASSKAARDEIASISRGLARG